MAFEPENTFFSRWSQRKVQAREKLAEAAAPVADETTESSPAHVPPSTIFAPAVAPAVAPASDAPPPPTLTDAKRLTIDSDFTPFVARSVSPEVKNAALKTLFSDPHFNIMDGLDTYIDDYSQPDPLPAGMLRQMVQSKLLGLFDDEDKTALTASASAPLHPVPNTNTDPTTACDENTALQLQPDDDAGRTGAALGTVQDPRCAH